MASFASILLSLVLLAGAGCRVSAVVEVSQPSPGYLMYAWNQGFTYKEGVCEQAQFDADRSTSECWSSVWDTDSAADDMVSAMSIPGREVSVVLAASLSIDTAASGTCSPPVVSLLTKLHAAGKKVYMLFAASTPSFPEVEMIPSVGVWNTVCGNTDPTLRFDGVAVNNEAWERCSGDPDSSANQAKLPAQRAWLTRLSEAHTAAQDISLPLHLSVGWTWGYCDLASSVTDPSAVPFDLAWTPDGSNDVTKPALQHMLDNVDSVDCQVAWSTGSTMSARSEFCELAYAQANDKGFYTLAYLNENSDCRLTFFPYTTSCSVGDHTEAGMWDAFGEVYADHGVPGGIHYYKGVYSSGFPGSFPSHTSSSGDEETHVVLSPPPSPDTDTTFPLSPDRGLYQYTETRASSPSPLTTAFLDGIRANDRSTLIFRYFVLDDFAQTSAAPAPPISASFLASIASDLATVRSAGMKVVLRFTYSTTHVADAEYHGDPTVDVVTGHIAQLAPILSQYEDAVSVMQAGFIGTWGEWHYSTHFGTPTGNAGYGLTETNWADRAAVYHAIMDALPSRMVQIRTPAYKESVLAATPTRTLATPANALQKDDAHSGSDDARTGVHNDCFLASDNDFGTFIDSDAEDWLALESAFTVVGGETCNVNPPRSECETALAEMERYHYSYLNEDYHPDVIQGWKDGGCWNEIVARLGFRLWIERSVFRPGSGSSVAPGGHVEVRVAVHNDGFAAPHNPHDVHIVLRHTESGQLCVADVSSAVEPRDWQPTDGSDVSHPIVADLSLPADMPVGNWDVLVAVSDSLAVANPRQRLLMVNAAEEVTGFNPVGHAIGVWSLGDGTPGGDTAVSCAATDAAALAPCPAGMACAFDGSSPTPCESGRYSPQGATTCIECSGCDDGGVCSASTGACPDIDPVYCNPIPNFYMFENVVVTTACQPELHDCGAPDMVRLGVSYWVVGNANDLNMMEHSRECEEA